MAQERKWTPGEWTYDGKRVKAGAKTVADLRYENGRNDAHLIAAAPELYEALEDAAKELEYLGKSGTEGYSRIVEALAKARGEQC